MLIYSIDPQLFQQLRDDVIHLQTTVKNMMAPSYSSKVVDELLEVRKVYPVTVFVETLLILLIMLAASHFYSNKEIKNKEK